MLNTSQTFAKYYVGVKTGETKLLDVPWNKKVETIEVAFPAPIVKVTKREILKKIAKIYDPSGLDSPVTLAGKMLYRETCDAQVPWDCDLPRELKNAWENWERMLTGKVEVPRSLVEYREEILSIDPRAFGDASSNSAAVYAVTQQSSGITQGLVTSKSRLAKKSLTIPKLELVAGHMATNLVDKLKEALKGFPIGSVYGWLDSSVALHWIKGGGNYKQFVRNRVREIQDKNYIRWRHVGTTDNPADFGSRGGVAGDNKPVVASRYCDKSDQRQDEATVIREVLAVTIETNDGHDELMQKWDLWTTIRDQWWVSRFIRNCRAKH